MTVILLYFPYCNLYEHFESNLAYYSADEIEIEIPEGATPGSTLNIEVDGEKIEVSAHSPYFFQGFKSAKF